MQQGAERGGGAGGGGGGGCGGCAHCRALLAHLRASEKSSRRCAASARLTHTLAFAASTACQRARPPSGQGRDTLMRLPCNRAPARRPASQWRQQQQQQHLSTSQMLRGRRGPNRGLLGVVAQVEDLVQDLQRLLPLHHRMTVHTLRQTGPVTAPKSRLESPAGIGPPRPMAWAGVTLQKLQELVSRTGRASLYRSCTSWCHELSARSPMRGTRHALHVRSTEAGSAPVLPSLAWLRVHAAVAGGPGRRGAPRRRTCLNTWLPCSFSCVPRASSSSAKRLVWCAVRSKLSSSTSQTTAASSARPCPRPAPAPASPRWLRPGTLANWSGGCARAWAGKDKSGSRALQREIDSLKRCSRVGKAALPSRPGREARAVGGIRWCKGGPGGGRHGSRRRRAGARGRRPARRGS